MAQVLEHLPGVRVDEERLAAPPIAGVSTSIAAFVGVVPKPNPLWQDKPHLVTSIDQFLEDYVKDRSVPRDATKDAKVSTKLSRAVFGFFRNGGSACYVVAVADEKDPTIIAGLELLKVLDDVSIIAAPGIAEKTVHDELRLQAETLADRFAILDPKGLHTDQELKGGGAVRVALDNSLFAAYYYPRILVAPDLPDDPKLDATTPPYVAPSGHIAGIYARTDGERGVHKAPANAVVRGAAGVEHKLTDAQQNILNPDGVNLIRVFDGTVTVWGARTLQVANIADTLFLYISTRRLMTYIEQSLKRGLRFAVFEPNNLALRQTIARSARGFLDGVWRDGALFGETPNEAYYVRFPAPFNRDEDRALGKLTVEIGLRVTFPAEFIILRIGLILQNATTV